MEIGQDPLSIAYLSLQSEKQTMPNYLSKTNKFTISDKDHCSLNHQHVLNQESMFVYMASKV